jgi:tetratricopeptide (TPR) repeat protein
MSTRTALAGLATTALLVACSPPDDQETGSIRGEDVTETRENLDPALVEALDNGNAAYRAGDYQEALRYYQQAVDTDDDVAAGWFGVYMAQLALGNAAAAESARARAQELQPGASLIHPEADTNP